MEDSSFKSSLIKDLSSYNSYFIKRYQNDEKKLKNLEGKTTNGDLRIKNYIGKLSVNSCSQLQFLVYIVFRYRNNIFHGNKGALTWLRYEEQIEKCTEIMLLLLENFKGGLLNDI